MFNFHLFLFRFSTPLSPLVSCSSRAVARSDLAFSLPESHLSILATAAEGGRGTMASWSMEEGFSYIPPAIREDITSTAGLPPWLQSPSPAVDEVIEGPSTRSFSTEHIEVRPPDTIVVERNTVGHNPSRDFEVPSSSSPTP